MKREDFKVSITGQNALVSKGEKAVSLSVTVNNGRQWVTLPSMTRDELMQLHDDIEKFFLEGISAQTLAKSLCDMSQGATFGIFVTDENHNEIRWQVQKLVVLKREVMYFVGIIGDSSTIASFAYDDDNEDIEQLSKRIIDYISKVSIEDICRGKIIRFAIGY